MFKGFETSKTQLTELAGVINQFKSEAVQLRLVELMFTRDGSSPSIEPAGKVAQTATAAKPKRKIRAKVASKAGKRIKKRAVTGSGAIAALGKLLEEGFFEQPRLISEICTTIGNRLSRPIKPNEISGKLGRMVHNQMLSRAKNPENKFVYMKA